MTRLCFFGNSHVAALRSGWMEHPGAWPSLSAQFVGAHKGLLLETENKNGTLTPTTRNASDAFAKLGGGTGVDLAAFDAFVIAGCQVALSRVTTLYRDLRWPDLPSLHTSENLAEMTAVLGSQAAALATLTYTLNARLGLQFLRHLREMTDKPIYLTSQPRASAALRSMKDPNTASHRAILRAGDAAAVSDLFETAAARITADFGGIFLPQPADTIEDHILTAKPFMTGAKRLTEHMDAAQPKEDLRHGNAAYGAKVISQLAARL